MYRLRGKNVFEVSCNDVDRFLTHDVSTCQPSGVATGEKRQLKLFLAMHKGVVGLHLKGFSYFPTT